MIPTLDGGARFRACLAALAAQRPAPAAVVVIDSGSRDGTPEVARAAGATLIGVAREDFDHGASRNRAAAALPEVDAIVFLVQDAVPRGGDCLARLAEAALRPGVGAATARQVAPPEAGWLAASTLDASPFASDEAARTGPFRRESLAALPAAHWRALLRLDDVACAVRASLFRAVGGFPATRHGEDALLAYDLLWAGWALQHEPRAVVEHGHAYDESTVVPRYRDDAAFFRERFGFRVRGGPISTLKGLRAERRRDRLWLEAHPEALAGGTREAALERSRRLRSAQVRAQREGSRGPLGSLPAPRAMPGPEAAAEDANPARPARRGAAP